MLAASNLDLELPVLIHPARMVKAAIQRFDVLQARIVVIFVHLCALLGQSLLQFLQSRLLQWSSVLCHVFRGRIPVNLEIAR